MTQSLGPVTVRCTGCGGAWPFEREWDPRLPAELDLIEGAICIPRCAPGADIATTRWYDADGRTMKVTVHD